MSLFYKNKRGEIEVAFPLVFTDKGQAEFDLEYGVNLEISPPTISNAEDKDVPEKARDNGVPTTK